MNLTNADLALAYELRQEGCCWKRIAQGLGCDHIQLKKRVETVMKHGLVNHHIVVSQAQIKAAALMRWHGLGHRCIANYLGLDTRQMQNALWNEARRPRKKDQ